MNSDPKIHIVIGTKAQMIKMAPVMAELQARNIDYNFIFTGQHQETLDKLRENFSIKDPNIILHKGNDITSIPKMFFWLVKILNKCIWQRKKIFGLSSKNDILLTHGDTFSTLLGALMGRFSKIKVAHVESGLRSFKIFHPFPEEITRLLTFKLSNIYFCPGTWAVNNLKKYKGEKVDTNLNTLYDSLQMALANPHNPGLNIPSSNYCICSIHRFENIFNKKIFQKILNSIEEISKSIKVLFILHPPTLQQLKKYNFYQKLENNPNIELRPRYDYFNFIKLLDESKFIVTDGGSNQEEAFYLGKPCLLLRKATERTEGLEKNVLISNYEDSAIKNFTSNYNQFRIQQTKITKSPSKIIVDKIIDFTNKA